MQVRPQPSDREELVREPCRKVFPACSGTPGRRRTYGLLSTYPPTPCGLATFSAALARALEANGAAVGVVRVVDSRPSSDPRVMAELHNGVPASLREATAALKWLRHGPRAT